MNTTLWILQGLMAFIFMFSGINKAYFDAQTLVEKGQTGVAGLPKWFIKFIGFSEILGALALVFPILLHQWNILTPISATCLGLIMIPAAWIHHKRNESKNVLLNLTLFFICFLIAYFRF